MKVDDMKEVERYLQEMKEFFSYIDVDRSRLEKELNDKELETIDLLHEIELASLNAIERSRVYSKLEKVRKDRRIIKNKLELVNTLKGLTSKYITKGICGDVNQVIENVKTLKNNQMNRKYVPRILKDLKCAKKVDEWWILFQYWYGIFIGQSCGILISIITLENVGNRVDENYRIYLEKEKRNVYFFWRFNRKVRS